MGQIKTAFHFFKTFVWIVFFVLSLSSCSAKQGFFKALHLEHSSPVNKTKTTVPTNTCAYVLTKNQSQLSSVSKNKKKQLRFVFNFNTSSFEKKATYSTSSEREKSFENKPPKYILFKRLKISIG